MIAGIVLTGGGSLLKDIDLLSEYHTGLSTRIGKPIELLAHGYSTQIASPIYSTAVGLLAIAIDNLKYSTQEVFDIVEEDDDVTPTDKIENEREREEAKKNKWMSRFFTYTRDFFEATPDSEF